MDAEAGACVDLEVFCRRQGSRWQNWKRMKGNEQCCVCIIVLFSTVHCIVLFCTHAYVVVYDVIVHYIMCVRAP